MQNKPCEREAGGRVAGAPSPSASPGFLPCERAHSLSLGSNSYRLKAGGHEGSHVQKRPPCRSLRWTVPTCLIHLLPAGLPRPWSCQRGRFPPPRPPFPGPSAEAGAGQGLLPGACRGLITTPCPAGAPLERPAQAGGRGSVPPLQAPCCARARGPVRGLLGLGQVTFRRKVLGLGPLFLGPYSSRSLSLRPRNARG